MQRRAFLSLLGSAIGSLTLLPAGASARTAGMQQGAGDDRMLSSVLNRIFEERVATNPFFATATGLDTGVNASLKGRLDTRPDRLARQQEVARTKKFIGWLKQVPADGLSEASRTNRDVVVWDLETSIVGPDRFDIANPQNPYMISQQDGAYFVVPDFLHSAHTIEKTEDAEAYLSRLSQLATVLDNETVEQKRQARRGYLAPVWSLNLAMRQMRALMEPGPTKTSLATSLSERASEKRLPGDWHGRAAKIVEAQIFPALQRQVAAIGELRTTSRVGDGLWRVPHGDEIYDAALKEATTSTLSASEIHEVGLQQVAETTAELDKALRDAGLTSGSVGQRLDALNRRSDQLFSNTASGKRELLASLNESYAEMSKRLSAAFGDMPNAPLEIRAVPEDIQDGASNGYYRPAAIDGSRPAIYFINLKSTADWPKYSLPALTFHEGVPGHHLQISMAQAAGEMPMLRRLAFYSAYGEGWALYAEQLADELGAYKGVERIGYLQSHLFRAERLVVDTGIHHKRWSAERAAQHMIATTGFTKDRVQREIERYCTLPGQACSYRVGHLAWQRQRQRIEQALGQRFKLSDFHRILGEGAMPLSIFESRVGKLIERLQS